MRHRIAKGLEFLIGGPQFGGALGHTLLQCFVELTDGGLGTAELGDVLHRPHDTDEPAILKQGRGTEVHRAQRTVFTLPKGFEIADSTAVHGHVQQGGVGGRNVRLREEHEKWPADQFVCSIAADFAHGTVDQGQGALPVSRKNGDRGIFEDGPVQAGGILQGFLGPSAGRDVLCSHNVKAWFALSIAVQGATKIDPDLVTLLVDIALFQGVIIAFTPQHPVHQRCFRSHVRRRRDVTELAPQQFLAGITEHIAEEIVDCQQAMIKAIVDHADCRLVEENAKQRLAFGAGPLQGLALTDILDDTHPKQGLTGGIAHHRHGQPGPDRVPILMQIAFFTLQHVHVAGHKLVEQPDIRGQVIGMGDFGEGKLPELRFGIAQELAHGPVDAQHPMVRGQVYHSHPRVLEGSTKGFELF